MADPLRLLLVVGETTGGIGRHVRVLAERLPGFGFEVVVAGPASALAAVGEPAGVVSHEVPIGRPWAARRALRPLLAGVDVAHAHGIQAGAVTAATRRGSGPALLVTWHNAVLVTGLRRVAHRLASRYAARGADLTLGASPDLTVAARVAGARDARDTFVVAPPMPAASRPRSAVRADLGVGERPVVLAVGRLQAQKRLDVLVAAAARWRPDADAPVVVIAGSGPDATALRAQAAASGAEVRLLGARDDVPDLFAAADVVALPSVWEARSLVAQEALRAGVPLVTTPVGGLPDLVGDAAVMVPVGDAVALGAALDELIADEGLRRSLADAGRARAATWPTLDAAVEELATAYRDLVARRSAANRRHGGAS
ncbi:MAG TPA: glycosyltransferase family 4 protein [Mycobacteriales bacterium]|nr:glycosyltransferase family 4 protein [Mycobacteriales bacterium]HVX68077.1 glycosyltransferase family 4 protein [Mycobacteriales bacterium]